MKRIAILASGSGTNAENIIRYFKDHDEIAVTLVLSNKKDAKVLERAANMNVENRFFKRSEFYNDTTVYELLKTQADWIVLAGFLWKVPENLIKTFENRMVNIHPALLPKYGGKGMYGMHVHNSVVANKEKFSGITIHYVNDKYDEGAIIFQEKVAVGPLDTAEDVATKIHKLEYTWFPRIIEREVLADV